jgi:hypothetical protein
MSKKDTDTDRRTLIVTVAAAGAAVAAGEVHATDPGDPVLKARGPATQIKVDLGGVRLTEAQAHELEQMISKDVLSVIGRTGVKGASRVGGLGPGIYGLIYRPTFLPGTAGMPGAVRDPTRQQ